MHQIVNLNLHCHPKNLMRFVQKHAIYAVLNLWMIILMESMKVYTSLIQYIYKYYDSGALFHSESLLKYHIQQANLHVIRFPFQYKLNHTRQYAYDFVLKWDVC